MTRLLSPLLSRLGLIVASTGLGMAGFLIFHGVEPTEAQASPLPGPEPALRWRENLSLEIQPRLLARAERPVDLSGDALDRLYVLEQDGDIIRIEPSTETLSVSTRYGRLANDRTHPELGFSAMALHPDFHVRKSPGFGKFYAVVAELAHSGNPDFEPEFGDPGEHHQDVLYEFCARDPLAGRFDGTRRELIRFSQPGAEHNLNSLAFDERGFLYLAIGDGAFSRPSTGSPSKNASSLTSAYGKVLRIDPLGTNARNGRYGIPDTNPFQMVTEALPELWAFGLRSPHSLSFDVYRRSLYLSDRSLGALDRVHESNRGGEHYGWDLEQGSFFVNLTMRRELEEIVSEPVLQVDRSRGQAGATVGALVYRGENFPSLAGRLVHATHDGQLVAFRPASDGLPGGNRFEHPVAVPIGPLATKRIRALRSTPRGELVFLCEDGSVALLSKSQREGLEKSKERSLYCTASAESWPAS